MMDGASEGNFKTMTQEEAMRMIENLVSSKNIKNADMHLMKSAEMDSDKIVVVKAKIDYFHEVYMV